MNSNSFNLAGKRNNPEDGLMRSPDAHILVEANKDKVIEEHSMECNSTGCNTSELFTSHKLFKILSSDGDFRKKESDHLDSSHNSTPSQDSEDRPNSNSSQTAKYFTDLENDT